MASRFAEYGLDRWFGCRPVRGPALVLCRLLVSVTLAITVGTALLAAVVR